MPINGHPGRHDTLARMQPTNAHVSSATQGRRGRPSRFATWAIWSVVLVLPARAPAVPPDIWLDANGRPSASARHALQLLADAPADGLRAGDYRSADLVARAAQLDAAAAPVATSIAAFERDIDGAMQRYLYDLHLGRIDPRGLGFRVPPRRTALPDFAALTRSAAAQQSLRETAAQLRPRSWQYGKLRDALARYRTLASDRSLVNVVAMAGPVKPGDLFDAAEHLQRLLIAFGDLPADAEAPAGRHDPALVQGVRRFQERHGLDADGVIGRATLAALNVPLTQRVEQLELALERLRWLPELDSGRFIGINIPMFRLWAWDAAQPAEAPISMGVVVGKALNTRTPVLSEEMRYLIFRPYWNVPRSIVASELLPAIARDPAYLQRHDMELVSGGGDDARAVAASADAVARLRQGQLRVRQRPGPKNSLGLVKFIFPNDANVYLHGTPATQLFGRARRDFSHGCVRLEDPTGLAQWVLNDQPQWTRARIEQAMGAAAPLRVNLTRPIPVIMFYTTAMVMPSDQALHFAPDIYGHDAALRRALAARPQAR